MVKIMLIDTILFLMFADTINTSDEGISLCFLCGKFVSDLGSHLHVIHNFQEDTPAGKATILYMEI